MSKNITVQKILGILLHRLPLILLSGILVGLIFFVYTSVVIKPVYSTDTMIYVLNHGKQKEPDKGSQATTAPAATNPAGAAQSESLQSNNEVAQKIFNSDLSGSAALASSCVTLFQNHPDIRAQFNGCSVNISVTENSFYITISASGTDPDKCQDAANNVALKCKEIFHKYFAYGNLDIIRYADLPQEPISPNKVQNTIIGVAIGILLACVISVLLELIDTTIKDDDDLSAIYKIPVFAEIPDFENSGR